MSQALTIKIKLNPTQEQTLMLKESSLEYISVINSLVSEMVDNKKTTKKTSASVEAKLNSTVKNQAIKDAKSVFQKAKKSKYKIIPILKKPQIIWNNQNYKIGGDFIEMPFLINGKSKRVSINANLTNRMFHLIDTGQLNDPQFAKYVKHNMACRALEDLIYHFNQETSIDLSLAHIWKDESNHQQFVSYIKSQLA